MEAKTLNRRISTMALVVISNVIAHGQSFSSEEIEQIQHFWSAPERYEIGVPENIAKNGLWQVRLTVAGSQWLWNYNRARGLGKVNPALPAPPPQNSDQAEWEKWIDAKVAWDRREARKTADDLNASVFKGFAVDRSPFPQRLSSAPKGLIALAGAPPPFAEAVIPLQHTMRFDDTQIQLVDNVALKPRYAYYRFEKGVMSGGKKVREIDPAEVEGLFTDAGLAGSDRRVMSAVSLLEGGFDAINTYDTGFVSVGFIQFASLKEGAGSLGRLLLRMKTSSIDAFNQEFRKFGIDVSKEGRLVALDLDSGVETIGPDANRTIIEDRRLIAVFQRAGQVCREFRVEQLRSAFVDYHPGQDLVSIQVGGKPLAFRISDLIRSEAGIATLMDRKVNTGSLDPLAFVATIVCAEKGINTIEALRPYERDILIAMKYRKDYLADSTLSQPPKAMEPLRNFRYASRKGTGRSGRGGAKPKGGSIGGILARS